jgi:hypothetical protein
MSEVKYRTVTISQMLDANINGQKRSTFVSATVDLGGVSAEEFRIEQMKVGLEVAMAALQNAVCRQELKEEEAKSRAGEIRENYTGFIKRLEEKLQKSGAEVETPF